MIFIYYFYVIFNLIVFFILSVYQMLSLSEKLSLYRLIIPEVPNHVNVNNILSHQIDLSTACLKDKNAPGDS